MKLNNNIYDKMKWVTQYLLPATATLYFALAGLWGLPYAEQVMGTIVAIETFLGILLGISSKNYQNATDGELLISEHPDKDVYSFILNEDPSSLKGKDTVTVKVNSQK